MSDFERGFIAGLRFSEPMMNGIHIGGMNDEGILAMPAVQRAIDSSRIVKNVKPESAPVEKQHLQKRGRLK